MWNLNQSNGNYEIYQFDEALPNPLLARLVGAVREIGNERLKENYDTTFWFPRETRPRNVAEEAIVELFKLANPSDECVGTEWWLGRLGYGQKLPFHFDRDLSLSRTAGEYVPPLYASILYLNSFPSSPTVILGQVAGADGKTRIPKKPEFRQAVPAVSNRYVVFSGGLRHGVVPDSRSLDSEQTGENSVLPEVARLSLLVNYWHRRPSRPICSDYDGNVYGQLQQYQFKRPHQTGLE